MIVVFGSSNVDVVMTVPRHPIPGETILGDGCFVRPGGKGANQAVAAAHMGGSVLMFGAVGDDSFGREMCRNLAVRNVQASGVRTIADQMTGCATITVDREGQNAICVAPGANAAVRADIIPDEVFGSLTTVVTQMEVSAEENWTLLQRAKARGARTILNLAPAALLDEEAVEAIKRSTDFLIVNETEAATLASGLFGQKATAEENARAIANRLCVTTVLTLGGRGARAFSSEGLVGYADALNVEVVDTTGAGDTFVGVLAAGLDRGDSLSEVLTEAAVAGSLACEGLGAQEAMPDLRRVREACGSQPSGRVHASFDPD